MIYTSMCFYRDFLKVFIPLEIRNINTQTLLIVFRNDTSDITSNGIISDTCRYVHVLIETSWRWHIAKCWSSHSGNAFVLEKKDKCFPCIINYFINQQILNQLLFSMRFPSFNMDAGCIFYSKVKGKMNNVEE